MLTLRTLINNVGKERGHINPTASFSVRKIAPVPAFKSFAIQAKFLPFSDPWAKGYLTSIVFNGINYQELKDEIHNLGVEVIKGQTQFMNRPSYSLTPVQVTCQCLDYTFMWQYFVKAKGSLAGYDFDPYRPYYTDKTGSRHPYFGPAEGRHAHRNKQNTPGCCKHIIRFSQYLAQRGLMVA